MDILAIIPARGGSKGFPKKNIASLAGYPLIYYSIKVAKESKLINRVIVSTDDQKIAEISRKYGAEVPFIRPQIFAQELTPDFPVFSHALMWLIENEDYCPDIVVQLRPTSPLRKASVVDEAIELLIKNTKAHCVRAVVEPNENPYKMWKINFDGFLTPLIKTEIKEAYNQPRQVLPPTYWQTGYIDVIRTEIILNKGTLTGDLILPYILENIPFNKIDIDSKESLAIAEKLLTEENNNDSE
ncbi:MAG: cytidylyltransferase domain-containing protein [Candidatus Hodarchaeota archaeon]